LQDDGITAQFRFELFRRCGVRAYHGQPGVAQISLEHGLGW